MTTDTPREQIVNSIAAWTMFYDVALSIQAREALIDMLAAEAECARLREALEGALKDIADGPQPIEDYMTGIRCGLEDRDLQHAGEYAAAEYGYERGPEITETLLDWCADIAQRALKIAAPQDSVPKPVATAEANRLLVAGRSAVEPAETPAESATVVVPREPTSQMIECGFKSARQLSYDIVRTIYRAMLAAAPGEGKP